MKAKVFYDHPTRMELALNSWLEGNPSIKIHSMTQSSIELNGTQKCVLTIIYGESLGLSDQIKKAAATLATPG